MPIFYWLGILVFSASLTGLLVAAVRYFNPIPAKPQPTTPTPPIGDYQLRCHYCDKVFDSTREPWIRRNCPNCKSETSYHRECGNRMYGKPPYCNGTYVGHSTGHVVSLKAPRMCAVCGVRC